MHQFLAAPSTPTSASTKQAFPGQRKFEPCFYAKSPETIRYAESVADLKNNKIIVMPRDEFAAKHGFQWTDSMLVEPEIRDLLWTDTRFPKKAWTLLEERLHNPLDCFVIVKINDDIGYTVFFVPQDGKPLPGGTLIGIYAASVIDVTTIFLSGGKADDFSIGLNDDDHQNSIITDTFNNILGSAKNFGNIARFMLDAPSEETLKEVPGDPDIKSNIITQNVVIHPFIYNGVPVVLMFLMRETMPYEQLVWPYEGEKEDLLDCNSFWKIQGVNRCLFNKEGKVMGHLRENILKFDPSYQASPALAAPRLTLEDRMKFQLISKSLTTDINNFNFKKRFYENVKLALDIFANRFPETTEEGKIIREVQSAFNNNLQSMDKAFTALRTVFLSRDKDGSYEKVKYKLDPLRKEISFHMNRYIESNKSQPKVAEPFQQTRVASEKRTSPTP
jgi:hypothetical protein